MFCLPHCTASCTSGSPGSDSWVIFDSASREAFFAASAAPGSASALASSPRAEVRPWSEPATASQIVFDPPAGRSRR